MGKKMNPSKRGVKYEKQMAKKHRGKHLGGPGKPDYQRGKTKGEVKNWNRPVDSGEIKRAHQRGISEIVSKSGFTKPAVELAKKLGIKLITKKKK